VTVSDLIILWLDWWNSVPLLRNLGALAVLLALGWIAWKANRK